jgi:hypothetical protein
MPTYKILSRYDSDKILYEAEAKNFGEFVEKAVSDGADLGGADLGGAYLGGAYLRGANLGGANLGGAYLGGAYLRDAYLGGAYLRDAKGLNKYLTTPLYTLLDQPGQIRAYKLVNANGEGPYNGGIKYEQEKEYEILDSDTDDNVQCGPGINIATLDWVCKEWQKGYKILIVEHEAKDIAAIPIGSDGKYRVFRCKVVGEKNLRELGLIKDDENKSDPPTE